MEDGNVAELLFRTADASPDIACITDLDAVGGPRTVTYAELAERAGLLASGFGGLGLGLASGDRVALLLPNSLSYVEAFLAAVTAGLVVVPLNVRLLREDYVHMLTDSGSSALITEGTVLARFPELARLPGLTLITTDRSHDGATMDDVAGDRSVSPVSRRSTDVLSLMYTSGTTGSAKAVALTHRSWASVADTSRRVLALGTDEVILHVAPLTHGAGFLLLPTIAVGGHNVICRSHDPLRTVALLDTHGVTGLFMVPAMIRMLLDALPAGWRVPSTFRRLYYAGSPIDPATLREATTAFGGNLVQSFAQMESPMYFSVLDRSDHLRATREPDSPLVRSAGRILPDVALRVVDAEGEVLPPGVPGEILARAPQTMAGYWRRPDETAATLAGGWLHTGDVGHLDEQGYLYVVDRVKDMIVSGGSNVYAREVEDALLTLPQVRAAAIIGTPHRIWGEAVTAVLVSADDSRDSSQVIAGCRTLLADYRVPKRVIWVDELPRNPYGKVLKRRLRERYSDPEERSRADDQ